MSKPIVAIVGRPNVGKFMLFSVIAGNTTSIVKDTPGVTKDWIYVDCDWLNMNFTLINIGGIEPDPEDIILPQMREQAEVAISATDTIIFIVGVRQGLVDSDSKVVDLLRKSHKPVVLAVNKVDSATKYGNDVYESYNPGTGEPIAVLAVSRLGVSDLLDEVMKHFDSRQMEEEEDECLRIVMVGKPNVGKSSIINKLVGKNRVIVSDTADTTRDVMDTEVIHEGIPYVFIDTTGPRRESKIKEELERYSVIRTVSVMEWAGVVAVIMDIMEDATEQDTEIAGIAHERDKGIIVAVSKWDAIKKTDKTIYEYTRKIKEVLFFIPYVGYPFISVTTRQCLTKLFGMIDVVRQNQNLRVATGVFNEITTEAAAIQQPPSDKGKWPRICYITQVAVELPTFAIFVNDEELMHFSYVRYLEDQIRSAFGFRGTSLKFLIRERKGKEWQV